VSAALPSETSRRERSHTEQARAYSAILQEEFDVCFSFFDARTGDAVSIKEASALRGQDSGSEPLSTRSPLATPPFTTHEIVELAKEGRPRVVARENGTYRLVLLLYAKRELVLVAIGEMSSLLPAAPTNARQIGREQKMLTGWVHAINDRLRLADQLQGRKQTREADLEAPVALEALLALDELARKLRIHKEPARNYQTVLETAFSAVPIQALTWIPAQKDQPVLVLGDKLLSPDECRELTSVLARSPDLRSPAPILHGDTSGLEWSPRFPNVRSLIAFLIADQGHVGWLVALNKKGSGGFRRKDAALLLPFASFLRMAQQWTHRYQDLKDLLVGLTRALTTALDAKDAFTYGHSERVARIAIELGKEMGLEGDDLGDLYLAGLLHDVGKIGIKDTVLQKREALTPEEREHIQQHVTIGYWILAELRQIRNLLPGVLHHHERYDGKGYPDGLAGKDIPMLARILAVADAYDAMSNQRPYRDALPYRRVEEILIEGAGTQWDQVVVDAFLRCRQRIHTIRQRGVGDSLRKAIDGALRSEAASLRVLPNLMGLPASTRHGKPAEMFGSAKAND
jgi:HD-GYP domain-containing protein (c-di-GMP phosphodiesterase class II)